MALAEEKELRADQFEFQMLYGMAGGLHKAIPANGFCLRVYVPYGDAVVGMAYLVRRLLENSSSQSLLMANRTHGSDPEWAVAAPLLPDSKPDCIPEAHAAPTEQGGTLNLGVFVNEPWHRFTDPEEHRSMRSAIAELKSRLGRYYPVRINGIAITTQDVLESVNPADPAEVIGRVGIAGVQHADLAVRGANQAFQGWSRVLVEDRAAILIRTARLLRDRRDRFAALEILEAGKTWTEADANITEAIDFLEFYAREAIRLAAANVIELPGEHNVHGWSALGVGVV
ncbi:MAG: proline dehydrogenase family protein, partial [Methylococcales bacterium]